VLFFASVSGGVRNFASGTDASVSGGFENNASGVVASVSGGFTNTASGFFPSVSGGGDNTASGQYGSSHCHTTFNQSCRSARQSILAHEFKACRPQFLLALNEEVPRAMDRHSSGCLPSGKLGSPVIIV
jgi:hypothetical protein